MSSRSTTRSNGRRAARRRATPSSRSARCRSSRISPTMCRRRLRDFPAYEARQASRAAPRDASHANRRVTRAMHPTATHRAIEAVWRIESAKVVAGVTRVVRDLGVAEELAQDALVAALETWPRSGVPDNPGAWLMATAKRRAIDHLRKRALHRREEDELGRYLDDQFALSAPDVDAALDDAIGDDLLRLMFVACHPVLATQARVALTLKVVGGLSTDEIARAFLVPEATIAQRIVRAKRTLAAASVAFEIPREFELAARLESVLEVIYLV